MYKSTLLSDCTRFLIKSGFFLLYLKGGEKPNDTRLATQAKQASRKAAKRKSPSIKRTIEEGELFPFLFYLLSWVRICSSLSRKLGSLGCFYAQITTRRCSQASNSVLRTISGSPHSMSSLRSPLLNNGYKDVIEAWWIRSYLNFLNRTTQSVLFIVLWSGAYRLFLVTSTWTEINYCSNMVQVTNLFSIFSQTAIGEQCRPSGCQLRPPVAQALCSHRVGTPKKSE